MPASHASEDAAPLSREAAWELKRQQRGRKSESGPPGAPDASPAPWVRKPDPLQPPTQMRIGAPVEPPKQARADEAERLRRDALQELLQDKETMKILLPPGPFANYAIPDIAVHDRTTPKRETLSELKPRFVEIENLRLGAATVGVDTNTAARQKEQYRQELEQQIREKENSRLVERDVWHGDPRFESRPLPSAAGLAFDAITYELPSRNQISERGIPVCTCLLSML